MFFSCYADENECMLDKGGCHQICIDTDESRSCDCEEGFELQDNGISCNGKNNSSLGSEEAWYTLHVCTCTKNHQLSHIIFSTIVMCYSILELNNTFLRILALKHTGQLSSSIL